MHHPLPDRCWDDSSVVIMDLAKLPLEILTMIFEAIHDAATLLHVLSTSRLLHSIVEPILYRNVAVMQDGNTPHTHLRSRAKGFNQRIKTNTNLAKYVNSLIVPEFQDVEDIIPLLVNLRRLGIDESVFNRAHKDMSTLRPLLLTHLKWHSPVSIDKIPEFVNFLESQPLLEFLDVRWCDTDGMKKPMSSLAPTALPNLHTLSSPAPDGIIRSLLPRRSVRHLDFLLDDQSEFPFDDAPFDTIQTLSCANQSFELLVSIAGCCPNLRYAEMIVWNEELAIEELFELLYQLNESKLEFLVIALDDSAYEEFVAAAYVDTIGTAFRHIPALQIVDVVIESLAERVRYRRNSHGDPHGPFKTNGVGDLCSTWDLWWQMCELDLE